MIYFFRKQGDFIQCEIYPGHPHVLTVIEPDGDQRSERYTSSQDLQDRWRVLTRAFQAEGWTGPLGRDARI